MHQSSIYQPLQRILVFTGSGTFFDNLINELLVFSRQLRGNRFPDHRNLRKLADIGVFCEVTLISADNAGQSFLHGRNVTGFCPHQNGFWHTASDVVHLQFLIQRIEERIGDRLNGIHTFQICSKVFITIGNQEFRESHGINLHEVDLAHREGRWLRQSDTQQRTGTGYMILRSILAEILHGVDDFRAVLHLVKDDEGLFWHDLLTTCQHQVL